MVRYSRQNMVGISRRQHKVFDGFHAQWESSENATRTLDAQLATFVFPFYKPCRCKKWKNKMSSLFMPSPPKRELSKALRMWNSFFSIRPTSAKKTRNRRQNEKTICKITAKLPHATPARRISLYIVSIAKIAAMAVKIYIVWCVAPSDVETNSSASATTINNTPDQMLN